MTDDLTLEKLKIVEKMQKVDVSLIKIHGTLELMNQNLKCITSTVDSHTKDISGNGKTGLKTQVDRIIQWKSNVKWWMTTLSIATIGIVSRLVYDVLNKLSP